MCHLRIRAVHNPPSGEPGLELSEEDSYVAARILARQVQIEADLLNALQFPFHDAGFRWIALIVRGIDRQHCGFDRSTPT